MGPLPRACAALAALHGKVRRQWLDHAHKTALGLATAPSMP
ncbi:hypothetical protein [Streptomyces sp. NPDC057696]